VAVERRGDRSASSRLSEELQRVASDGRLLRPFYQVKDSLF